MNEIKIDNIEKLLQSESSEKLLKKALESLKVDKDNIKSRVIVILISSLLAFLLGFSADTVMISKEIMDTLLNVLLALFGTIFTGYALLQTFMNKQLLIQLMSDVKKDDTNEKSRLQVINETFVYLMLLIILAVIGTLVIKLIVSCISNGFVLFEYMLVNNILAGFIISIYFSFIGIIFCRVIAFISTIFQLFNAYSVTRIIEILDDEDDSSEQR